MNKELELEADLWSVNTDNVHPADSYIAKQGFIAGATSKYVEKQKLEFAIEELNQLDTILQSKVETLKEMASSILKDNVDDFENFNLFNRKIEGVRLAKEEIRRQIKELEQQLKELENN